GRAAANAAWTRLATTKGGTGRLGSPGKNATAREEGGIRPLGAVMTNIDLLTAHHSAVQLEQPRQTPRWTVTMPLAILPTQPRYWRCTPGVLEPDLRAEVSSKRPTVPRSSAGKVGKTSATWRCSCSRTWGKDQRWSRRNSCKVRTAQPEAKAMGSTVLRLRSERSPL